MLTLKHHGAVNGVTGSCHEFTLSTGEGVLVDCGLFQGAESAGREFGEIQIDFAIDHIKALLITHCHLDHVGRIPHLLAAGFDGPIYATEATAALLPLVIEDAVKVGVSRDERLIQLVLARLQSLLKPIPYDQWFFIDGLSPKNPVRAKFRVAGHILGSAYIEVEAEQERVVFSGDLGATHSPLLPAPKSPYRADRLIIESTYGDKLHEGRKQRRLVLKQTIERCLQDRGAVLIPAFSIGRTQELLYEIEDIIHRYGGDWEKLPVIVDSPLASEFTTHYRALRDLWDKEARRKISEGRHPLAFDQLITIKDHAEHIAMVNRLKQTGYPCIVIAASGMCTGGRILNYLEALLPDNRTDVVFVGYQAKGTLGRDIQTFGPQNGYVMINDQRVDIRAGIHSLSGYSAHADQENLLKFIKRIYRKPFEVRIVHGDDEAKLEFAKQVKALLPDANIFIPTE